MTGKEVFDNVMSLVQSRAWPNHDDWENEWKELEAAIRPLSFEETSFLLGKLHEQECLAETLGNPNPIFSCVGLIAEGLSKKFIEAVKSIEAQKGLSSKAHQDVADLINGLPGLGLFLLGETKVGELADSALTYHAAGVVHFKLACSVSEE